MYGAPSGTLYSSFSAIDPGALEIPTSMSLADVNGDGRLDVVFGEHDSQIHVLLANGR